MKISKPLVPIIMPWKDPDGKLLTLSKIYFSRLFTYNFLIIIWLIWYFLGEMSSTNCISPKENIGCSAAIWHNKITNPMEYLISFFTAPLFYNSKQHITFTTISFIIFVQSFEAKKGTIMTMAVFFSTIVTIGLIGGIVSNLGHYFFPDIEIFSYLLGRNWMGASSGFMGIIGSMSHQSKNKYLFPALVICFEYWNFIINGISIIISLTHGFSCIFGFIVWKK